jgi:hypothetical protein
MTTDEQTMTKIETNTAQRTGRHSSQRKEVLFFANAHFLFFNLSQPAFGTFAFAATAHTDTMAKAKEPNLPTHFLNAINQNQFLNLNHYLTSKLKNHV